MVEVIYVHDGSEVMIGLDNGKIVHLYTYNDSVVQVWNDKLEVDINVLKGWTPGQNPLFINCPKTRYHQTVKRLLQDTEFSCCGFAGVEESERDAIVEMLRYYKWMYEGFADGILESIAE